MGKIRNRHGEDRETLLGFVAADAVTEVPDAAVYGYTLQAGWEPVDKAATTAHNAGAKAEREAVEAERRARGLVEPEPDPEPVGADD